MTKKARDERLFWFVTTLAGAGGQAGATAGKYNWLNTFWNDRQDDPDTFNLAEHLGYTSTSHDTFYGISTVRITDKGKAYVAA